MVVPETQTQENEDDEDEQVADGDDDEEEDEEEDAYEDCYWTNDIVLIVCQLPSRSYQRPYACSMCNHLNRPSRPLKQCRNTNTFITSNGLDMMTQRTLGNPQKIYYRTAFYSKLIAISLTIS